MKIVVAFPSIGRSPSIRTSSLHRVHRASCVIKPRSMTYHHKTPFLGPLLNPEEVLPLPKPHRHRVAYTDDTPGMSPTEARQRGASISGRVLMVTTNFTHVPTRNRDGSLGLRSRRGLSSLTSTIDHIAFHSDWELVHVAWPGEVDTFIEEGQYMSEWEKRRFTELINTKYDRSSCRPVWLDPPHTRWREYAESVIWPKFHYIQTIDDNLIEQTTVGWQAYVELNHKFAEVILKEYRPGDIIWIHDTYFLLLPKMLREKLGGGAAIGMYIHEPFPSSEFIRCLPQRSELLRGMQGASLCAFQSQHYVRHFISTCARLSGLEHHGEKILIDGRYVRVLALPLGIDVFHVVNRTTTTNVRKMVDEICGVYEKKLIIVGRDKLDAVYSIMQKLRAFEILLEKYSYWRGRVVLIQVTTLPWQSNHGDEKMLAQIISHINARFGTIDYTPILHFARHIDQDEYFALMEVASLGYFIPAREATSHAALEYIACQRHRKAPIVLSEFLGIASALKGGFSVNPYDASAVAVALDEALRLPVSQRPDLYEQAARFNIPDFVTSFLSRLLLHEMKNETQHSTPEADTLALQRSYSAAKSRLFLFDYDGTLTPIVSDPAAAVPSEKLKKILRRLTSDRRNSVWIISGRDSAFLDKHLGEFSINMSAEHGCFVKYSGDSEWTDLAATVDPEWQKVVMEVLQSYTERTEGSSIERKRVAITWHYRRADPVFGAFQASHLRPYLEITVGQRYPVVVMNGKANIEIRPRLFNKGEIVRSIFRDAKVQPEFVLCLGDDTTDEDMFRVVNDFPSQKGMYTCLVGPHSKLTTASWHLPGVPEILDALDSLK